MSVSSAQLQIEESAQDHGVEFRRLSSAESAELRQQVISKFVASDRPESVRMCEWLAEPCDVIPYLDDFDLPYRDFIGENLVFLFFEPIEDMKLKDVVYSFKSGHRVQRVAEECGFFTFYITNETIDYLIAYSEEQYLFFAGTILPWFEEQRKSLNL